LQTNRFKNGGTPGPPPFGICPGGERCIPVTWACTFLRGGGWRAAGPHLRYKKDFFQLCGFHLDRAAVPCSDRFSGRGWRAGARPAGSWSLADWRLFLPHASVRHYFHFWGTLNYIARDEKLGFHGDPVASVNYCEDRVANFRPQPRFVRSIAGRIRYSPDFENSKHPSSAGDAGLSQDQATPFLRKWHGHGERSFGGHPSLWTFITAAFSAGVCDFGDFFNLGKMLRSGKA